MGQGQSLEDQMFDLRYASKQLQRTAAKLEKEAVQVRMKVKKAIEQRNMEGARLYAQDAIRKRNERLHYLQLASRLDAVATKLDTAVKLNNVSSTMRGIVSGMSVALKNMQLEKVADTMSQFERQFEDLDVQASVMSSAIDMTTATTMAPEDVDSLVREVADQHGIEITDQLAAPGTGIQGTANASANASQDDVLEARLAQLRNA